MATGLGALALALPAGPVRAALLLLFVLLGPGNALLCHIDTASPLIAWGLAITAGLTIVTLGSAAMIWTATWRPLLAHVVLLIGTVLVALARVVLDRRQPQASATPIADAADAAADEADGQVPRSDRSAVGAFVAWTPQVLLLVATALWMLALSQFRNDRVDFFGLTLALGAPFIAAILLTCTAFATEVGGRRRTWVIIWAILELLAITRGTTAILLELPQYPWTYKHLGVVELFSTYGRTVDVHDIYQQWPGFFTAAAYLFDVGQVAALDYAKWAPLFFAVLQALLVAGVARAITRDPRVIAATAFLTTACAWPETNYFSPQAFATSLALGFLMIVLVWLRSCPAPGGTRRLRRLRAALVRGCAAGGATNSARRWASAAAVVVFFAIASAHQLTPFLLLSGLAVLAVLGLLRPRYLVPVLAAVAALYTLPRLDVATQFNIFNGLDVLQNASGNATEGWATAGQRFSALAVRGLAVTLWAAALFVAWRTREQFGRVVIPMALGFSPFAFMLVGNYGGELIYRVYSFALPWCALMIAAFVHRFADRWRALVRALAGGVALSVLTLAALQATNGQFAFDYVSAKSAAAAQYFYDNARPGSILVLGTPIFPGRLTANYWFFNQNLATEPSLLDVPEFRRLGASDQAAVAEYVSSFAGSGAYLAISRSMSVQADYFGYLPTGSLDALSAALRSSDDWQVFYENDEVVIFEMKASEPR